jgi:hypothetical protein
VVRCVTNIPISSKNPRPSNSQLALWRLISSFGVVFCNSIFTSAQMGLSNLSFNSSILSFHATLFKPLLFLFSLKIGKSNPYYFYSPWLKQLFYWVIITIFDLQNIVSKRS